MQAWRTIATTPRCFGCRLCIYVGIRTLSIVGRPTRGLRRNDYLEVLIKDNPFVCTFQHAGHADTTESSVLVILDYAHEVLERGLKIFQLDHSVSSMMACASGSLPLVMKSFLS
jgi:hypothetical protein